MDITLGFGPRIVGSNPAGSTGGYFGWVAQLATRPNVPFGTGGERSNYRYVHSIYFRR